MAYGANDFTAKEWIGNKVAQNSSTLLGRYTRKLYDRKEEHP